MKNTFKTLILGFGMMTFVHCQQVNPVTTGPFTPEEPTGNGLSCPGTDNLNCFIDFPTNSVDIDNFDFTQNYDQCMNTCLASAGCGDIPNAAESCPNAFASCDAQCNIISSESPLSEMPPSDGLTLPENPKAILVEVTGCFATGMNNEIHFKGPEINVVTPIEGIRRVYKNSLFGAKKVNLGYGMGRHPSCPSSYKNKVLVKSTPVTESVVNFGSNSVTVVPFATSEVFTKTRSIPHSLGFSAISTAIKDELDLKNVVVVPKSFGSLPSGIAAINDWRYFNNSDIGYGATVLFVSPYMLPPFGGAVIPAVQKVSVYIFAPAASQ